MCNEKTNTHLTWTAPKESRVYRFKKKFELDIKSLTCKLNGFAYIVDVFNFTPIDCVFFPSKFCHSLINENGLNIAQRKYSMQN